MRLYKKISLLLLTLFSGVYFSYGAIAFDNSGTSLANGSYVASITAPYTVSGSDTALVVYVDEDQFSSHVTGVTYNGVAMTQLSGSPMLSQGRYWHTYMLLGAPTGTHNIVVTADGGEDWLEITGAVSYTGVAQVSNPEAYNTCSGSGVSSLSCSVTTITADDWVVGAIRGTDPSTWVSNAGTTRRTNGNISALDSNGPISPAGSASLGGSWGVSSGPGIMMYALVPVATGGGGGGGGTSTSTPGDATLIDTYVGTVQNTIEDTTGWNASSTFAWFGPNVIQLYIGYIVTTLLNFKGWIIVLLIMGALVSLTRRAFRFYKT